MSKKEIFDSWEKQLDRKREVWLLFDVNFLAWRAFYTTGTLSYQNTPTGVVYGVLRDIMSMQSLHNTNYIAFCFDHGVSLRCIDYPGYKGTRRNKKRTEQEQEAYLGLQTQIRHLKTEYLEFAGFRNVFFQKGYEADDVIASLCQNLQKHQEAIIISADHDMYQLLSPKVCIWNPNQKQCTTLEMFQNEWGIEPEAWIDVKAIAGCNSDDIRGIDGVGEKTAAKFLTGALGAKTRAFSAIVAGNATWKRNRPLIKLPFPGIKNFHLRRDQVTPQKWERLASRLGMKSLRNKQSISHQGFGL